MPLKILLEDIVNVDADIYVNSAHPNVQIGTGVDFRIHQVAGPSLFEARKQLGRFTTNAVYVTDGYALKARYVYHILTPIFEEANSVQTLKNTYEICLEAAFNEGFESIAFPLLASGNHGFPKDLALEIATKVFKTFLKTHEMMIILTVFDKQNYQIKDSLKTFDVQEPIIIQPQVHYNYAPEAIAFPTLSESFHTMLFRLIDEREMTDVEVYKNANLSRKLFSKIRSDKDYQPSKKTVIALAIGLKLNLDQTLDFLSTAGFTLSESLKFDQAIQSFIELENYDIFEINAFLFYYDLPIL